MKLSLTKRILSLTSIYAFALGMVGMPAAQAKADPMREFVLSCAYGTLAGTLVGVASLAFSDKPGDNLNRVARGASIGLYGGILLGAYIVNNQPGENEEDPPPGVTFSDRAAPVLVQAKVPRAETKKAEVESLHLQIYPLVSERGIEGGAARISLLSF